MSATHYAGGLRTVKTMCLRGWAACVSGYRAEYIRNAGNQTLVSEETTCHRCLQMIMNAKRDGEAANYDWQTGASR